MTSRHRQILLAILAASLAHRAWYWLEVRGTRLWTVPYLDAHDYHAWARALVAGDWGVGEPYWMGPLYPHLLAVSYLLFGVGSEALLVGQLLLSVLNVWLVWRLGRRWLAPPGALLAAALFAAYGPPVFYAGLRLMATVVTTLMLLIAWQADRARVDAAAWRARAAGRRGHGADPRAPGASPRLRPWLMLGLLVGLTATARGNVLALLPLLPLLLIARPGERSGPGRPGRTRERAGHLRAALPAALRPAVRPTLALWLGAALAIAPVTVRNLLVGGDLVLLTSNAGVNLLIGQQAQYGGKFGPLSEVPQFEFDPTGETLLESDLGRDLQPSEVSRELTRRALERMAREPGTMLTHYSRKAYRFLNGYELPQIHSWNFWRERHAALRALPVPAWLLLAGGLAGAWVLPRGVRRLWLILMAGWLLGLLPFFPTARYRLPVMPLLALASAAWALAVFAEIRARWLVPRLARQADGALPGPRDPRNLPRLLAGRPARLLGAAALLAVALWPAWTALDRDDEWWHCHLARASRAADAGDRAAMLAACAEAERLRPGLAETPYRQGGYLEKLDDLAGALAAYTEAQRRLPDNPFVLYRRARTLAGLGRHAEALSGYAAAAAADPAWSFPWHGRALSLRALGRPEAAAAAFEEAIAREPGRARYHSNLASLLGEMGHQERALAILRRLTADFPDYVPGWFNLALLQARRGELDAARETVARLQERPRLTAAQQRQLAALARELDAAGEGR